MIRSDRSAMLSRDARGSDSSRWETPPDLFAALDAQLSFTVDVAASPTNAKVPRHFSESDNGLAQSWEGETFWCNPPYGRALEAWVERCRRAALEERAVGVALVPCRPDTEWWGAFVLQRDGEAGRFRGVRYVPSEEVLWYRWSSLLVAVHCYRGRVSFLEADRSVGDTAPFPVALVLFASPSRRPPPFRPTSEDTDPRCPRLTLGWPR
jgi:phage N-6-adenine-methyltransferase